MPKYYVEMPYTGKLMVQLEANSQEEALTIIYNTSSQEELEDLECVSYVDVEEELHEEIVEGNVFHGILNRLHIEECE